MIASPDPALPVALRAALVAVLEHVAAGRVILGHAGSWRDVDPISLVDGSELDVAEHAAVRLAHLLGHVTTAPGTGPRRAAVLTPAGRRHLDNATAHLATCLGNLSPLGV